MNDVAIEVLDVDKTFKLPHDKSTSVKSTLVNKLKRRHGYEIQQTLKDVNFTVKRGEFFGIVGKNGSGKSTLLKLISGIYTPTQGEIKVHGKLTPFIELGVGFNPELTGRENVYLNGALLGFSRKEVAEMYEDIVKFAEIERFMDQKLKNYSSGMQVRLAFSIAIKARSDILIFDEVLAVGDTEFQKKCYDYFRYIKESGTRTVVLVTHDMTAVQRFCDRAIVLNGGKIVHDGDPNEAAIQYQNINFPNQSETSDKQQKLSLEIVGKHAEAKSIESGQEMEVKVRWSPELKGVKHAGVALIGPDGSYVFGANTIDDKFSMDVSSRTINYKVSLNVGPGMYTLKAAVFGATADDTIFFNDRGIPIQITSQGSWGGLTRLPHQWVKEGKR